MASDLARLSAALAGRFRIEGEIGAGGMARVLLATDQRLGRRVALKVIKPELAGIIGADRFLREIAVGARLTHPHIVPLFDSGDADGLLWYAMPYLEGESLAARLLRLGPLPLEDAVRFAREVAQALDYAHRLGVIHRDIKPDNILIHEEQALVADFGIALVVGDTEQDRLTSTGLSIGTPRYMSPEQASGGRRIDHRTDLYSLGTVLYEMLTGEPPFSGGSLQAQIARIMTERPVRVRALRSTVPEAIERAVDRALAKAPADRFRSTADMAAALEGGATVSASPTGRRVWYVAGGAAASVLIVMAFQRGSPAREAAIDRAVGRPAAGIREERQLTTTGDAWVVSRSPDGRQAAFLGDSLRALMLMDIASGTIRELSRNPSGLYNRWIPPRWDRNGRRLLVHSTTEETYAFFLVDPVTGRQERFATTNAFLHFGADDSTYVAAYGGALYVGPAPTTFQVIGASLVGDGRLIDLRKEYTFISTPRIDPGGRWVAFVGSRAAGTDALAVVGTDGRNHRVLVPDLGEIENEMDDWLAGPEWSADARTLYFPRPQGLGWSLWSLDFDPGTGRARGSPRSRTERLPGSLGYGMGADGSMLYSGGFPTLHLTRLRRTRRGWEVERPLTGGTALAGSPALSPNGERIAYIRTGLDGRSDIFLIAIDGGQELRVTGTGVTKGEPAWSPDGRFLAYTERSDSGFVVMLRDLTAENPRRVGRVPASASGQPPVWSPDGRLLLFQRPSNRNYQVVDLATGRERPLVANDSVGWLFAPLFEPSGNGVVVYWHRPPRADLWRIGLSDSSQTRIAGTQAVSGDVRPHRWRTDGTLEMTLERLTGTVESVILLDPRSGRQLRVDSVRPACRQMASLDDSTAVCSVLTMQSDVWLARIPR
jgi:serine/threonine-protein kinase